MVSKTYIDHELTTDMYLWCQNNISISIFEKLFNNLANHLWNKFIESDGNFLNFLTRLDHINKSILFKWLEDNYQPNS